MAVTTSVFPNLNTFRQGPEFCILFRKLESTCQTHKKATLIDRYPALCQELQRNPKKICQKQPETDDEQTFIDNEQQEMMEEYSAPHIDLNDQLTKLIYR